MWGRLGRSCTSRDLPLVEGCPSREFSGLGENSQAKSKEVMQWLAGFIAVAEIGAGLPA